MSAGRVPHRRALVTGASTGIGRAIVEALVAAEPELTVWGTSRRGDLGWSHARVRPIAWDLLADRPAERLWALLGEDAPALDLIVNNAGWARFGPLATADGRAWEEQVRGMLVQTAAVCQRWLPALLERDDGAIVNVSSLAAEFPLPFFSAYNVAKAGLSALSASLQFETEGTGVRVIDWRPGDIRSDFHRAAAAQRRPETESAPGADRRRLQACWESFERYQRAAPPASWAAQRLVRALRERRRGVVRCAAWPQLVGVVLAQRVLPVGWRTAAARAYFRMSR